MHLYLFNTQPKMALEDNEEKTLSAPPSKI